MKKGFLIAVCFMMLAGICHADESLLPSPNNKVGIHVSTPVSDEDIIDSANLINSNGGEWGYMMLVLQRNAYVRPRWQETFDKLRLHKIIPCIRVATEAEGSNWKRPENKDAYLAAYFLNSLSWPTKMQCVVLFNEPNHGSEWGGTCDGADYADKVTFYSKVFKQMNPNFFVMMAGFDQSAPESPPAYCDEGQFVKKMMAAQPELFAHIDGWSSHSYPNPGFSASPLKRGRGSIDGYNWELALIGKNLPIFITETGWSSSGLSQQQIANNYLSAYTHLWLPDDRIKAVMPFILTYITEPFAKFSWRQPSGGQNFYPVYDAVKSIQKQKGKPQQIQRASILAKLPKVLVVNSTYQLQAWVRNDGQAIWDKRDGYEIKAITKPPFEVQFSPIFNVLPGRAAVMTMLFNSAGYRGKHLLPVGLYKDGELVIKLFDYEFEIVDEPSLQVSAKTFPSFDLNGEVELLIYDKNERLVFKEKNVKVSRGLLILDKITGITLGDKHRVVIIFPSYLPRQEFVTFKKGVNGITFKPLLPGDFNKDGKWSIEDLLRK
ncbi:MAG: hypothetical protein ACMG6E_02675 [Candidatus Roizmanbacteria bacterium]